MSDPAAARWPVGARILVALLCAYTALVFFPAPPGAASLDVDRNWQLGLGMARASRLQHGVDVIFPYGPLAYLFSADPPSGDPRAALAFRLGTWGLWVVIVWLVAGAAPSLPVAVTVIGVMALHGALNRGADLLEPLLFGIALLASLPRCHAFWLCALALGTAVAILSRLSLGVTCVFMLAALSAFELYRQRRVRSVVFALACLPLALLLLCAIANGGATTLRPFLGFSWELISGYDEGMALPGPAWPLLPVPIALALILVVAPLVARERRPLLPGIVVAAGLAAMHVKHAFVRQDAGHMMPLPASLAMDALFVLLLCRGRREQGLLVATIAAIGALGTMAGIALLPRLQAELAGRFRLRYLPACVDDVVHWERSWRKASEDSERALSLWRMDEEARSFVGTGSVDVLPWELGMVWVNGFRLRAHPVLQLYAANTPALDLRCARFLEERGADTMLVASFSDIDGVHPFLRAALTWRAILDRYDLGLVTPQALVLRRRAEPRFGAPVPLSRVRARWDEPIRLPDIADPVLCEVRIERSVRGVVRGAVFRPHRVFIDASYASGQSARWRAIRPNLAQGFLASVLPRGRGGIRGILDGDPPWSRVVAITFRTNGPKSFASDIDVRFLRWPRLDERGK